MYDNALPHKRKNDEIVVRQWGRLMVAALVFLFNMLVYVPLRWVGRALRWCGKWSGAGIVWAMHKAGRLAKWLLLLPVKLITWLVSRLNLLLSGAEPTFQTAHELEIYRRIRRYYRRRNRLITHGVIFLIGNGVLWLDWFSRMTYTMWSTPLFNPYVLTTLVWGMVLILHYVRVRMGEAEDRALEAALAQEYARQAWHQPLYYEESEYYGDYPHLADEPPTDDAIRFKAKRQRA